MIKTLLMALTCLTSVLLKAQNEAPLRFHKGSFTISGAIGFKSSSLERTRGVNQLEDDVTSLSYSFEPAISLFLSDHFAIGSRLIVGSSTNKLEHSFENTSDLLRYGFFGSYYFTPEKRFSLFGTLGADFIGDKEIRKFINRDATDQVVMRESTGVEIGVSAGLNYFVSTHFALNARLGILSYMVSEHEYDNVVDFTTEKVFRLNTDLSNVSFGVLYRI